MKTLLVHSLTHFLLFNLQHVIHFKVEADIVYAADMFKMNQKVNRSEQIVGWWATGNEVTTHSSTIHEYYLMECNNPVHITLDTTLKNDNMGLKAYVR